MPFDRRTKWLRQGKAVEHAQQTVKRGALDQQRGDPGGGMAGNNRSERFDFCN
jgi:hypothetical protein